MGTVTEVSFQFLAPDDNCLGTDVYEKLFHLILNRNKGHLTSTKILAASIMPLISESLCCVSGIGTCSVVGNCLKEYTWILFFTQGIYQFFLKNDLKLYKEN